MTAYEILLSVPARTPAEIDPESGQIVGGNELIPGEFVPDHTIIEGFETKAEAEAAALEAFPEGTKLIKNGVSEVDTAAPPVDLDPSELEAATA